MSEVNKVVEFEPPATSVNRVIKNVLPENIQMTKEARAAFVRAAGIFVFYLTHASNEFTRENKRQTVFPQDVVNALKYVNPDFVVCWTIANCEYDHSCIFCDFAGKLVLKTSNDRCWNFWMVSLTRCV
jgi:histone H3/H4